MRTIINNKWGILICGAIFAGLVGCSSSPSPWSQDSDSPWKAKRDAEADSAPSDEFVTEVPADEPLPLEDIPEPAAENEAWPYTPPEEAMEQPAETMVVEQTPVTMGGTSNNEAWISGLPATDYAVQMFAGRVMSNVTRYQETHNLGADTRVVKTDRDGDVIYVLVHVTQDRASAKQYMADIEAKTGSTPWIRSVGGLQKIVAQ